MRSVLAALVIAYPAHVPRSWHPPSWWLREAVCIHEHESGDWRRYDPPYANGFQFTLGTWNEAGPDYPNLYAVSRAPMHEQVRRAYVIWHKRGGRWSSDWATTSRICGLR